MNNRRGGMCETVASIVATVTCVAFLALAGHAQNISTVAGGGPPNGVKATSAPIGFPWGVVQDSSGNTYISDNLSNRILKIDTSGNFNVVAGNTVNNFSGDGGAATAATLSKPEGIALDSQGNVYIADTGNNVIRVVNTQATSIDVAGVSIAAGDIATVAGNGLPCSGSTAACGDTGLATAAQLSAPAGVAVDGSGNIYIADTGDNRIREVAVSGIITTFAGTGTACSSPTATCGDGANAASAQLNAPGGVAVDGSSILIADTSDNRIREVTSGTISTVAGNGTACAVSTAACGDGGAATSASLTAPLGVFVESGNIYIADTSDNRIREITAGTISTFAGNGAICTLPLAPCGDGGPAISAELNFPSGVFVNSSGAFIADQDDDTVRQVASGNISRFAGIDFNESYFGDGGSATSAELHQPFGIAFDSTLDLFIADAGNNAIREVNTKGDISTAVGNGLPCGTATCGDGGPVGSAQLFAPADVFLDSSGNIFIADSQDEVIRVVNTSTTNVLQLYVGSAYEIDINPGDIATAVGNITYKVCSVAPCGDGGAARSAQFNTPSGVFLDKSGNIYIADTRDNVIRVANTQASAITIAGVTIQPGDIAAVAGDYTACATATTACGDGANAAKAQLNGPESVFLDASGAIYISDSGDDKVRVVNPQASSSITVAGVTIGAGDIATIAGTGAPCQVAGCGDNGPGTSAQISHPGGIFVDNAGDVFISDSGDSIIRRVNAVGNIQTVAGNSLTGFSGDGGAATSAQLARPVGLRSDGSGNLFIADFGEWRVREVAGIAKGATSTALTSSANPSALTQSVTFTATVTSSSALAPTGTVTFMDGATALGSPVTLNGSGVATLAISTLSAGTHSITAVYSGDANFEGSTSSPLSQVVLTQTATTTTLTVSASSVNVGTSVTFTAKVTAGTATPTGTVTFNNGATELGSAALSSGTATLATSSLAAGSYSVTATYTGASNYAASTSSAVALSVQDFTIAANPTTVTVSAAGQSGTTTVTITPLGGFNQTLSYSCSGLPAQANCQFTAASSTTETVTISTTAATARLEDRFSRFSYALLFPGLLGVVVTTVGNRKRLWPSMRWFGVLAVLAGMLWLPACGGSSSSGSGSGNGGTPTGNSKVTITAATSGSALSHATTITLTVQ